MRRGFEPVENERGKIAVLPKRSTSWSAGYDLVTPEDIIVPDEGLVSQGLGFKVAIPQNEAFLVANRSSSPKKGYVCPLGIGVIDADYYNNVSNEGEIFVILMSVDGKEHFIPAGTRIAQGMFMEYHKTDDDDASGERVGGLGSTGI